MQVKIENLEYFIDSHSGNTSSYYLSAETQIAELFNLVEEAIKKNNLPLWLLTSYKPYGDSIFELVSADLEDDVFVYSYNSTVS